MVCRAVAVAAAAILFALPSMFCACVGDSLAANAFSVCNISTGFRDAGQSGRMGTTSGTARHDADSGVKSADNERYRTDKTKRSDASMVEKPTVKADDDGDGNRMNVFVPRKCTVLATTDGPEMTL